VNQSLFSRCAMRFSLSLSRPASNTFETTLSLVWSRSHARYCEYTLSALSCLHRHDERERGNKGEENVIVFLFLPHPLEMEETKLERDNIINDG